MKLNLLFKKSGIVFTIFFIFSGKLLLAQTASDCPYCDLTGQDFSGQNLQNVNFLGAKLDNANFQGTDLTGAYLSNASLQNANFQQATLGNTSKGVSNLCLTNLTGANFSGATIGKTLFYHATVTNANFSNTNLSQARFGTPPVIASQNAVNTVMPQPTVSAKLVTIPMGNSIYVSNNSGVDNSTCGTLNSHCKTITQGITNCTGSVCNVLVEYGQYTTPTTGSVNLKTGTNIFGGFYNGQPTAYQSVITLNTSATDGTHPTIWGNNVGGTIIIANFIINGTQTTGANRASMVMQLNNCANVQLDNVNINAVSGGTGSKGTDAIKGNNGGAGGGGGSSGGTSGVSAHPNNNAGGTGGNQTAGYQTCDGFACDNMVYHYTGTNLDGFAGQAGSSGVSATGSNYASASGKNCAGWIGSSPGQNSQGVVGTYGVCGGTNTASTDLTGYFSNGLWTSRNATTGTSGGYGGGGGGGGGGSAVGYCNCVCSNPDAHYGTAGGGGGSGGEGATGGIGGMQGGASIGILLYVSKCTIGDNVKIVGGAGGIGGAGGAGALGGNGGAGGSGGATNNIGNSGGTGGQGGNGCAGGSAGSSGGGAGGNGGPSYCIVQVTNNQGNASALVGTPTYYNGISGGVGTGGNGASDAHCTGGKGATGVFGSVMSLYQVTSQ